MGTKDPDDNRGTETIDRRNFLRSAAAATTGAFAGTALVGSASAGPTSTLTLDEKVESDNNPDHTDPGQHPMVVDAFAFPNAGKPEQFFDALETGFEQLYDELGLWSDGYVLRKFETTKSIDCSAPIESMAGLLSEESTISHHSGLQDPNRVYHFAIPCEIEHDLDTYEGLKYTLTERELAIPEGQKLSIRRSVDPPWGGRDQNERLAISTVSDINIHTDGLSWLGDNNYKVRAFHEVLHMFIDGDIASTMTGVSNGYRAQHTLGSVDTELRRTVMADLQLPSQIEDRKDGYEDEALSGGRCGAPASLEGSTKWPEIDDLSFSTCTKEALEYSHDKHALGFDPDVPGHLPRVGDNTDRPTDPDGDGLYEDVNGNGKKDLADAVDLYQNRDTPAVQNNPSAFDFSGNGAIDLADVVDLHNENSE